MAVWISSRDFEKLCFNFTRELLTFSQPIPDYETRNNDLLESTLAAPQQTFGGQLLYPTLIEQAAILFYLLIKNHPFQNGNKRIAVMSLLVFLSLNNKWISINPVHFYELAIKVASSKSKDKDKTLRDIEEVLKKTIIQRG